MKFSSLFAGMLAVAVVGAALPASTALAKHGADDRQSDDRGGDRGGDNRGGGNSGKNGGGTAKPSKPARPARVTVFQLIGRAGSDNAGGVKARARYATRTRATTLLDRRFDVEIENATPGTVYPVSVNGTQVGTITADALGEAELEFRLNPSTDDDNDLPFPDGFPSLVAGDTVSVAGLTITLAARR